MDYKIKKSNDIDGKEVEMYAVVDEDETKVFGWHKTKKEAQKQIDSFGLEATTTVTNSSTEKSYVPYGVSTFEELDEFEARVEENEEIVEAAWAFPMLVENALYSTGDSKKAVQGTLDSLVSKMKNVLGLKKSMPSSFSVYKGSDGRWFWIAKYSNNIIDNDFPPDIISSQSHKSFVEMVDKGEADYPELWLWHEPEWNIGKATWLTYDEDNGVALAAGYFYPFAYGVAEKLAKARDWGLSHGMPNSSIERDEDNPKVIVSHKTAEISPLPLWAAANKLTGFEILNKEANMAITDKKRQALQSELGIDEDTLASIEQSNAEMSKSADALGLERKETEPEVTEDVKETEEITKEEPDVAVAEKEDETKDVSDEKDADDVDNDEKDVIFTTAQTEQLKQAFDAFTEQMLSQVTEVVKEAIAEVKEVKEAVDKDFEEKVKSTPQASLAEMLFGNPQSHKASTSEDTLVDGRTSFAKSKPKETESDSEDVLSGSEFTNMVAKSVLNFGELVKKVNGE